jgi:hypothetical protein
MTIMIHKKEYLQLPVESFRVTMVPVSKIHP